LPNDKCLLIYDQGDGSLALYLEPMDALGHAIRRSAFKKPLQKDKLGDQILFAYDESKRTLAVSGKLQVSFLA
jgi:hypothetical protein